MRDEPFTTTICGREFTVRRVPLRLRADRQDWHAVVDLESGEILISDPGDTITRDELVQRTVTAVLEALSRLQQPGRFPDAARQPSPSAGRRCFSGCFPVKVLHPREFDPRWQLPPADPQQ